VVVLITAILLLALALIALVGACLFLRYTAVADYDARSGVGVVPAPSRAGKPPVRRVLY
jgi:hypothetical protein